MLCVKLCVRTLRYEIPFVAPRKLCDIIFTIKYCSTIQSFGNYCTSFNHDSRYIVSEVDISFKIKYNTEENVFLGPEKEIE